MFAGAYTAIVTPFRRDGSVDYARFRELIEAQIAGGIDGLVPVGTTGESPTVGFDEHKKIIEVCVEQVARRVKVIAGAGGNATSEAVELTRHALAAGADATLQVTPYYNKPNNAGLIRHFSTLADLGGAVVLYNVPGRSSREIPVDVVATLAKHPRITCIKEAGGSVDRVSQILDRCSIEVLSGDDALTLPMMSVGALGVISVASNVAPKAVADLVHHALAGRWADALAVHRKHYRLFTDLFLDTNPIPVKTALALMGRLDEVFRLPLCETTDAIRDRLKSLLGGLGLLP